MSRRADVLVLLHAPLTENMSGPEIRGWEVAKALHRRGIAVTVAAPGAEGVREGIPTVPRTRVRLLRDVLRHRAVLAPNVPPFLYLWQAAFGGEAIADLYDPVDLEHADEPQDPGVAAWLRALALNVGLQLRFADLVLCASEPQRERLRTLAPDDPDRAPIAVVPFGLDDPPEATGVTPIRDAFARVGSADPVVLWWGSIWRWFDAPTAIRAFAELSRRGSAAKLVLAAGRSPRAETDKLSDLDHARALADELGLMGTSVFFLDEWIPYERRHTYLQEADLGLTLHRAAAESPFAARARYMDYLWCHLPCLLNAGDPTAEEFAEHGFGRLAPDGDPAATADVLERWLAAPDAVAEARRRGAQLAERYRWSAVVDPLVEHLQAPGRARRPRRRALLASLVVFYRARAAAAVAQRRAAGRQSARSAVAGGGS
jgi:glycosyltransferase involved in cell wall biosynthesis